MLQYINIPPQRILGMIIFLAIMLSFIIWVKGFRKRQRQLIKNRNIFFAISGLVILLSLGAILFKGLNFGLDFTGGTVIQLAVDPSVKTSDMRKLMAEYAKTSSVPAQFADPKIQMSLEVQEKEIKPQEPSKDTTKKEQPLSSGRKVKFRTCIIQVKEISSDEADKFIKFLKSKNALIEVMKIETIGPIIGKELESKALIALTIALFAQLIYITFRFGTQLRYGIAADIALIHDLIIMVGIYTLLGKPIDSPFVAALLTIIGYSVMDTVVVFDRVRENLKLMQGDSYEETVNISLNQVMTRTSATSFTTIIVLFAIYYFGGQTLHNFSLALLIGTVAGTYSSLFIASPLIVIFDNWVKAKEKQRAEERRRKLEQEALEKAKQKEEEEEKKRKRKKPSRKRRK